MPRPRRPELAGLLIHVINRAVRRATLFSTEEDFAAFERVMREARARVPLRIVAFCVMPNHWHLVAWPTSTQELSRFMHWLTLTHALRWHRARGSGGTGAVYQGRFKAFAVQSDESAPLRVCRYVERNALRAGLVERAETWRWGSLWHRLNGNPAGLLVPGPAPLPADWRERVNEPQSDAELAALRHCVIRGTPCGSEAWVARIAPRLGLESALRALGRPRKRD